MENLKKQSFNTKESEKKSFVQNALDKIEVAGNKLPHPVTIFALLCVGIAVISAIAAATGLAVEADILNRQTNEIETQLVSAVSLLSADGIKYMLENAVTNFTSFAPLGVVLVGMLGIGVFESSGYIGTILKKVVSVTPAKFVVPVVALLGIMSNIASDAGYVILIPLAALVFMAYGKHPLAGIATAFAGVSGGFSANLLIGTTDPMLAGITNEAAHIIDASVNVTATANYFFMAASTIMITIVITLLTTKIIEPRLGKWDGEFHGGNDLQNMTDLEKKALKRANATLLILVIGLIAIVLMPNSVLRNLEASSFVNSIIDHSTLMNGLIPIIAIMFFIPSVVYGKIAGTMKNEKEVCAHMTKSMSTMGGYLVLAFVASQFISYFSYTNLATIIAVKGATILEALNIGSIPLMLGFILITAFINLFMGSASAKWAIMAPVFIPMFMQLNLDPALVQAAYRVADSTTNIISPLMTYFAMVIVFMQAYKKDTGIGTVVSLMIPYSMSLLVCWSVLLVIWMLTGLPIGF